MSVDERDRAFLRRALEIGRRGLGRTSPNPAVGAVVVRGGKVVGEGFHRRAGGPHAEVEALRRAGTAARGATLYCTLEPCSHHGRTPPCAPAVAAAGIARVVVGTIDPNRRVRGRGIRILRRAGVATTVGVEEEGSRELLRYFAHRQRVGRPFVRLKLAASLDGRIAARGGSARWITGGPARALVHRWRDEMDAVLVGSGTAIADDPALTCRRRGGRDPLRIVLDGRLRLPPSARMLREGSSPVWIVTSRGHDRRRAARLERAGAVVVVVPRRRGGSDLGALLDRLGGEGVLSVLVEGGGEVAARFLDAGLVDEVCLFTAPLLLGGDGISMVGPLGVTDPARAPRLRIERREVVGADLLTVARPASRRPRGSLEGRR
ncbi:bifunctional diaminohydroxyphosphoribosylaminopyrimidine deaminase/5-amino-6-(5-phosphoribosylamino)uracil reductase RibD [bacterium]|nr:bifunctional diaminohydroxyphosphoribosylaminopyrimidine deaminase/5-amino-6-(5-phosphoribosylamino)uracil reductase RibD [bacterium]